MQNIRPSTSFACCRHWVPQFYIVCQWAETVDK